MRKYIWTFVVAVSSLAACNDNDEELSEQKPVEVRTSAAVTGITDHSAVVSALITGSGENLTQRGVYYAPEQGFAIAESTPHAEAASLAGPSSQPHSRDSRQTPSTMPGLMSYPMAKPYSETK